MNLEFGNANNEQMRNLKRFLEQDDNKGKEGDDIFESYFKANLIAKESSEDNLEIKQVNRLYHEGNNIIFIYQSIYKKFLKKNIFH